MIKNNLPGKAAALLLAAALLFLAACSGPSATAATMHLRRTEGTVSVSDSSGKSLPALNNLSLYSGYGVGTSSASYAWIDLDDVKLTKLDQNSEAAIQKEGKALSIELKSGSLFFNVTQPLEDDETMNIRTSTMLVGIRGTCGWVSCRDDRSQVYLLEGKVECSAGGQTVRVSAGEMAELSGDGELTVKKFTAGDVPSFVQNEVDSDLPGIADAPPGPDGPDDPGGPETPGPSDNPAYSDTPEPSASPETPDIPAPTGGPEEDIVESGDAGANVRWTYYGDGTLVFSGTGPMQNYAEVTDDDVSINIPSWYAYSTGIRTVTITSGVSTIGSGAFYNLRSLNTVNIPGSVTRIGAAAFHYCTGLTEVTIPAGVVIIEERAFYDCSNLRDVYYGGSPEQWGRVAIGTGNDPLVSAALHCG